MVALATARSKLEVIRKWKCLSFVLEIRQIVERHVSLECAQGLVPPVSCRCVERDDGQRDEGRKLVEIWLLCEEGNGKTKEEEAASASYGIVQYNSGQELAGRRSRQLFLPNPFGYVAIDHLTAGSRHHIFDFRRTKS